MKKFFLLLLATAAIGMTANAQSASFMDPSQVMKGSSSQNLTKAPKKTPSEQTAYYNRPAGGFVCSYWYFSEFEEVSLCDFPLIALKPNAEYTFKSVNASNENWTYMWDVYNPSQNNWYTQESQNITINSGEGSWDWNARVPVPVLRTLDDEGNLINSYQLHGKNRSTNEIFPAQYLASNDYESVIDEDNIWWLFSSKTMVRGGRFDDIDVRYNPLTYYAGLNPWGSNEMGWWFGKNDGGLNGKHVDGIAQAFEKPEHPYILKHIVMFLTEMDVAEDCELTCKIYRLADGIPAYQENSSVSLPLEPGELIATGRAQLSAHQSDWGLDNVVFTLYGNDGQVITPTINDAILIAIDGYNDPEMDALTNFTAMKSYDDQADEGFGELAYMKYKDDTMDDYEWCGLNNFFGSFNSGTIEMKTGFTIFITLAFPDEEMEQTDAPVITWTANEGVLTVTATGNGNVVLNVGNETANGEGTATITVEYNIYEGIEVGATAYAQENGKLVSETVEENIVVNAVEQEQTEAPIIQIVEIANEYVIVHVAGNGALTVWVNGQEATLDEDGNIELAADQQEDMIYVITATAQETGKLVSETAELIVEVPAYQPLSGLNEINSKSIAMVRYYNLMGQEIQQSSGTCIVVTTYTDGTTTAVKVMK